MSAPAPTCTIHDEGLALVMTGGGARAAYQVGFLCHLARRFPDLTPPILTGVSAGAINAAFLASHTGHFAARVEALAQLWRELRPDDVFRVGPAKLGMNALRWGFGLLSGGSLPPSRGGMVDTSPLSELLAAKLGAPDGRLTGVDFNLRHSPLEAVAITTASYTTGRSVTWVQGQEIAGWERANRIARDCELTVAHVLASSALPLFFPAVKVGSAWYGDGGMRLTAPLAPAVHLGARRILAISTRYGRTPAEAELPMHEGYPPLAQVAGTLLKAVFLDQLDDDALRLERINRMLANLAPEHREGMRVVDLLVLRPSRDLGELANEYEADLPRGFRFLTRGLGTRETRSNDFLSLVMFQADYLSRLLELGERDAEARADEIGAFLNANCPD
jgi:NTE family protein